MQQDSTFRKWLPYLVSISLFLIITLLYFAPQFKGETLVQHDVLQYNGMAKDIVDHRATFGEDPQWEGRMFGGMPAYLINMKYDGMWLKQISKAFMFLGEPAAFIFVAMFCFFAMLLLIGIGPWVALAPSLAYGLSTYFFIIIGAGHITKMIALAFAPMLLGAIFCAYRRHMWLGVVLSGIFASFEIGANHPQITYYFLLIIAAFWVNELVRSYKEKIMRHFVKVTLLLALVAALAVGSNAGMLYYTNSHTAETIRGGSELVKESEKNGGLDIEYATSWSYGIGETFNMLVPNLYGGTSEGGFKDDGEVAQALGKYNARQMATSLPGYWGPQPITSGPVYVGAVMIFLAVFGLFLLAKRRTIWIVVVTLLAIILSWGSHLMWFTELFFNYFPLYNKFRTVSMILVIVEWSVPFLVAITLQQLYREMPPKVQVVKALKYSVITVGGIAALLLIFGGMLMSFSGAADAQLPDDVVSAMRSERASMLQMDALRSLVFVLLSGGVVWLFLGDKIKRTLFIVAICGLVCLDMIPVNLRYLNNSKFVPKSQAEILPTSADKQILEDKSPGFRVLNLTVSPFNDATTSYFHRSVGGYHGAKLQRYQDLIERHLSQMNWGVYNMLNTKYVISSDKEAGELTAQLNPDANGAAWFVNSVKVVSTPEEEISALGEVDPKSGIVDTKSVAVIDKKFEKYIEEFDAANETDSASISIVPQIEMTEYRVNHQSYKYSSPSRSIAVFSEIYYPKGWTAYIDGVEAPYFRADYILRAMLLPVGDHTVEFKFKAPNYNTLATITLISSLLLLISFVVVVGVSLANKKRKIAVKNGR